MQLVAYGAQDVYLTGNPQITFFKVVYRRHTNFSVECIQQTWNGAADFGRTVTCNINRNGDLITNMYVAVELNSVAANTVPWGYVTRLGHVLIEDIKIEIGGSKIDEQYGDWLNIWYELTNKSGQQRGYKRMIGDVSDLTNIDTSAKNRYQLYVPLQFWFNRNNGLALPLIALQYHDVRITLKFRDQALCYNYQGAAAPVFNTALMKDSYLLIDYVYLDSEERKRFAQASHEYLIEQLQFTGSESLTSASNKYRLNFNHPSKYLVWAPHLQKYSVRNNWVSYAHDGNWQAARDRFARVLAVAQLKGTVTLAENKMYVAKTDGVDVSAFKSGDLIDPERVGVLNAKLEVKIVAQADGADSKICIAAGATHDILFKNLLDNILIVRNDLTIEDISTQASLFKTNYNITTGVVSDFVDWISVSVINYFNYGNFIDGSDNPVYSGKLQLNGHDRFQARDGYYFNYVQPYQHFSNTPADGINVYSFALKPEDHQPSGTCNFSRIDNATLQLDLGKYNSAADSSFINNNFSSSSNSIVNIYTVNYNVLRVMSGMAGTAYSN